MGDKYKFKTEDGDNTIPLIGLLLLLIVLVSGALYIILTAEPPEKGPVVVPDEPDDKPPPGNDTNTTYVCGDDCFYEKAILASNVTECKKIENVTLMQECFEQLADVSLAACLEVSDPEKKKFCVTSFAVSNNDVDICDLIEDGRAECRRNVDDCIGSENENLCRAIKDSDPYMCKYNTDCLMDYSITRKDDSGCKLIQNPVISKACEFAVTGNDACYTLRLQSERDYCYETYALNTNNFHSCKFITKHTIYYLNCLSTFAANERNISICTDDSLKLDDLWKCYTNYSLLSGDISGCEAIHKLATTNRFNCAFTFAKLHGDPSACQVIESLSSRDTCYQGAIIYSNENLDPKNCKNVTSFHWKHKCYNEAAKLTDDVTVCDEIEEEFARNACVSAYKLYKS
ncbi:hypothetical protein JXA56_02835 [Candidatus Micrarchaeota archaeon]|nr:hypothetical protein [Candidatus Micrarchaeota archaeon]